MSGFWKWVYEIQPVVWASMIAFGGASVTVIVTAWTASKQRTEVDRLATLQRQHDAEQRDRERLMALRIDTFVRGAEGVALATTVIGKMGQLSIPDSDLQRDSFEVNGRLARVQVIGDHATTQAVSDFSVAFTAAYVELTLERELFREQLRRYEEDPGVAVTFGATALGLEVKFARRIGARGMPLARLSATALFAVRRELGLPTDQERFLAIQESGLQQLRDVLETHFAKLLAFEEISG